MTPEQQIQELKNKCDALEIALQNLKLEKSHPAHNNVKEKLAMLEEQIGELKKPKKDGYDRLAIFGAVVGGILVPIAVAVTGLLLNSEISSAEIQSQEKINTLNNRLRERQLESEESIQNLNRQFRTQQVDFENSIKTTNTRIAQSDLTVKLMEYLIGGNPQARSLAIAILLDAYDGEEGRKIVESFMKSQDPIDLKNEINQKLIAQRQNIENDFFSVSKADRSKSYQDVLNKFRNDTEMFKSLIETANTKISENPDAVVNLLRLLKQTNANNALALSEEIVNLANKAKDNGPISYQEANQVKHKIFDLQCEDEKINVLQRNIVEEKKFFPFDPDIDNKNQLEFKVSSIKGDYASVTVRSSDASTFSQPFEAAISGTYDFFYKNYWYRWSLVDIDKQFITRDKYVVVSMTKSFCPSLEKFF